MSAPLVAAGVGFLVGFVTYHFGRSALNWWRRRRADPNDIPF